MQHYGMGERRKAALPPLLQLFIQRVNEELDGRPRSVIYKAAGGPKQKTLNDVLLNGADPSIATVSQIAHALGIPAWELFLNKAEIVRLRTQSAVQTSNVTKLPGYPPMLGSGHEPSREKKPLVRKTRAR